MNIEHIIEDILIKWNEKNGYDIEDIIQRLGYTSNGNRELNSQGIIKLYQSSASNLGILVLSEVMPPVFMTYYNNNQESTIIFEKNIKVTTTVSIPSKYLGTVEYGTDLTNPKLMKFYSAENSALDRSLVLPDEIKIIDKNDPIGIISDVIFWAADIRRSLAPSKDIIISK